MAEQVERLRFFDVINRHPTPLEPEDVDLIQSATVYGAKRNEGQKRQSGEPYFSHPVAVAVLLSEMDLDSKTIAAGLLHDVVEDTVKNAEQLKGVAHARARVRRRGGKFHTTLLLKVRPYAKLDAIQGYLEQEIRDIFAQNLGLADAAGRVEVKIVGVVPEPKDF